MDREYDLFERLPDGSVLWRGTVSGLRQASLKLEEIAKATANKCFAMYMGSREIVARLNPRPSAKSRVRLTIFQIAYDAKLAPVSTDLLTAQGYNVVTVYGNEAAQRVLALPQAPDLFIVGHLAPEENRKEVVAWLKENYPGVPILALHAAEGCELAGADYNVKLNGPDAWLSTISTALI
jgi:CheY-like chemotaxis protein